MTNTISIPIVSLYNKELRISWHLAYKDEKIIWLSATKPRNWKSVEKRALRLFQQEDPKRNPNRMTIFEVPISK